MSAPVSNSMRGWRRLFLILETVVVATFLGGMLWGWRIEPQSEVRAVIVGVPILLAWLFLLIGSPFFLRSLRGIALAGWIIAFGILVLSALSIR